MNIVYIDEYDNDLYRGQADYIPAVGDVVTLDDDEDWKVKFRNFYPKKNTVIIELSQTSVRAKAPVDTSTSKISEMQNTIAQLGKRQDGNDKRIKSLREQTMSIRQHIRRNQPKPKETQ